MRRDQLLQKIAEATAGSGTNAVEIDAIEGLLPFDMQPGRPSPVGPRWHVADRPIASL
jgi:hypothetical protein